VKGEHHFFKKVPLFEDAEEFNTKKTHIGKPRSRDELFSNKSVDAAYLPLGSVEEDNNEEEVNAFKLRKKLADINLGDLNEFNTNDKTPVERRRRKCSLQISTHDSILEEKEGPVIPHLNNMYGSQGSLHNSPATKKLKVDELDFLEEKKNKAREDDDSSDIDPIMEEAEERNKQVVDENKEYQAGNFFF